MSIFTNPIPMTPSNFVGLENLAPEQTSTTEQTDATQNGEAAQSDPAAEGDVATQGEPVGQTEQNSETASQSNSSFTSSITPESGVVRRPFGTALFHTLHQVDAVSKHDRAVKSLHNTLASLSMVTAFSNVAKEYNLSAPMVAAFQATPGFDQAVKSFPALDSFNLHPAHPTSSDNVLGLESFAMAETQTTGIINDRVAAMVTAYDNILTGLPAMVGALQDQIADTKAALEASDLTDEVLASLSANLIENAAMMELLNKFDYYLANVEPFSVDDLRAHPEQVMQEATGVSMAVTDAGGALGLALEKFGLVESDRDPRFEASQTDFGTAGYSKVDLAFFMDKADGVLDKLKAIGERKDELSAAMHQAATDMPAMVESDDISYGGMDHVLLMNSYSTLNAKLVSESVMAVTTLMTAVDSVVNIDTGIDA